MSPEKPIFWFIYIGIIGFSCYTFVFLLYLIEVMINEYLLQTPENKH